jgi:hypothetical protein
MGKSWYEGKLIEASNKPRVIWDKKGEHVGLAAHVVVLTKQRWAAMQAKGPANVWPDFLQSYPSVRITTHGLTPASLKAAAASCAGVVHARGKTLWVGTEYHNIAPNGGSLGECPAEILVLHTDSRTCQNDIIIDSQRPALVDTTIMSQPNRRVGFGMDDPNDLKRTAGYFRAVKADAAASLGVILTPQEQKAGRVPAIRVFPAMPPLRCLHLDCDTGEQVLIDTSQLTRTIAHQG